MSGLIRTVLGEGFRAFFLAAGLFGAAAMLVWATWLGMTPAITLPAYWHAHEMIFGYATAALGGFFLTAVPSWTGTSAPRRLSVTVAIALWLAGRVAFGLGDALGPVPTAIVDLAFLPLLAAKIAVRLVRRPKPQNVMFLGLLAIIWSGNLAFHLGAAQEGLRVGLLGITALIAVLGGRVTPAFTRNALTRAGIETGLPRSRRMFDLPGIALAILLPILVLIRVPDTIVGAVAVASGMFQALRLSGWRLTAVLDQPILWSLHLGFVMLAAGYVAFGLARLGLTSETAALHVLGIGAVGGMTVAVMSRAILGHSRLPLVASGRMTLVYRLVAAAAVVRVLAEAVPAWAWTAVILGSAVLWIAAFLLFIGDVWPVVTRDARPGD